MYDSVIFMEHVFRVFFYSFYSILFGFNVVNEAVTCVGLQEVSELYAKRRLWVFVQVLNKIC